jgi:hypothetical protein
MADVVELVREGVPFRALELRCLHDAWRAKEEVWKEISKGQLLAYLNPVSRPEYEEMHAAAPNLGLGENGHARRVIDRDDLGQYKLEFEGIAD